MPVVIHWHFLSKLRRLIMRSQTSLVATQIRLQQGAVLKNICHGELFMCYYVNISPYWWID